MVKAWRAVCKQPKSDSEGRAGIAWGGGPGGRGRLLCCSFALPELFLSRRWFEVVGFKGACLLVDVLAAGPESTVPSRHVYSGGPGSGRKHGVEGRGLSAVARSLAGARGWVAALCGGGVTESKDVHVAEWQAVGGKAASGGGQGEFGGQGSQAEAGRCRESILETDLGQRGESLRREDRR